MRSYFSRRAALQVPELIRPEPTPAVLLRQAREQLAHMKRSEDELERQLFNLVQVRRHLEAQLAGLAEQMGARQ